MVALQLHLRQIHAIAAIDARPYILQRMHEREMDKF